MNRIVLGKSDNKNIELNLEVLLRTHLLIWASTGGGKSWLIRRLAEQLFGRVPVIIVDREGEFSTLREKFGFVLVGQGGETPADMRSAKLVAEKLLELRASAVCDLYELKHETRHEWVKAFVNGLVDAPKRLWGPTVIIIDEAHLFCPEKGQGESVAYGAVADLAGQGRKRGFGIVLATQRLSKLSKNATGEMFNQAAGPTARQADRDRAAYEMGISDRKEIKEFSETLRRLENGNFFFQGRAIAMDRLLVKVGTVETSHPEAGSTKFKAGPPPAPEEIKALLPKLADLPKAAEDKARTEGELKAEVRRLKTELSAAKRTGPAPTRPQEIKVGSAVRATQAEAQKQFVAIHASHKKLIANGGQLARALTQLAEAAKKAFLAEIAEDQHAAVPVKLAFKPRLGRDGRGRGGLVEGPVRPPPVVRSTRTPRSIPEASAPDDSSDLTASQHRILRGLAELEAIGRTSPQRETVAFWAEARPTSGGFKNNLGALRSGELIEYPQGGAVSLTEKGREVIGAQVAPAAEEVFRRAESLLTQAQKRILEVLRELHPEAISREDLAERAGVPATSGGFKNNLGAMRTAGLLEYPGAGTVRCAAWLFVD